MLQSPRPGDDEKSPDLPVADIQFGPDMVSDPTLVEVVATGVSVDTARHLKNTETLPVDEKAPTTRCVIAREV